MQQQYVIKSVELLLDSPFPHVKIFDFSVVSYSVYCIFVCHLEISLH